MRKLLNTLYITSEDSYLHRDGENLVIKKDGEVLRRFPIHILEGVVCFNYSGASPGAIKLCNDNNISLALLSPNGQFYGRFIGKANGNVLLRREQYRMADDWRALDIGKNVIISKLSNSRKILMRLIRDHSSQVDADKIQLVVDKLMIQIEKIGNISDSESLRGIEGEAARDYFRCFDSMILQQKSDFYFRERSRRPPMDRVNAMLSFFYSILTYEIVSALEVVGLDSYVGFLHTDRPGRPSLALDLIEEFRAYIVDRFVLTCINKRIVDAGCFIIKENESVLLTDTGRAKMLDAWQKRKNEEITHPFLEEKVKIGLLPYVQAQLLARHVRGDLKEYPPFLC